jgi:hypothetical protein
MFFVVLFLGEERDVGQQQSKWKRIERVACVCKNARTSRKAVERRRRGEA